MHEKQGSVSETSGNIAESYPIMVARPHLLGEMVNGARDLFRVQNLIMRDLVLGFLLFQFIVIVTGSFTSEVAGKLDYSNEFDENVD